MFKKFKKNISNKYNDSEIDDAGINQLIKLAKKVLWASPDIRKRIQDHNVNVVPGNFYSEIPLIDDIENSFEYRNLNEEVYNNGLFSAKGISNFINEISYYADEFTPPLEGDRENPKGFFWKNPAFSFSDVMSYYCILRHFKPKKILEIGSGFSTLVANMALSKNGFGDLSCFSFHKTKNIISGEGGCLAINNLSLVKRAEVIREKGTNRKQFFQGEVEKYTVKFNKMCHTQKDWFNSIGVDVKVANTALRRGNIYWQSKNRIGELDGYGLAAVPIKWIETQRGTKMNIEKIVSNYTQSNNVLRKS